MLCSFFYPGRCPVCDGVLPVGVQGACGLCGTLLEYVQEPMCKKCGKPLQSGEEEFCMDCRGREASFECGYGLWVYDSAMKASIGRFKYRGRREYAGYYAQEMYRQYGGWIEQTGAQALIPVPVHRKRYRKRGYNQAALIARQLGRLSGIPVREQLLLRCRDTLPQKELSVKERRENLKNAFLLNNLPEELNQIPECAILVDDIYTTGCTLEACARVLRDAGVHRVYFLCACIGKGF